MPATLMLHQKKILSAALTLEIKLWEVTKTAKYPDGVKYSLIVINTKNKKMVLMDNHSPKGHHYHLDKEEFNYDYSTTEQLIIDFRSLVKIHLGVRI